MQYALVNGVRTLPQKGLNGICPACIQEVIAKCGKIKIHHWAHKSLKDCDVWWEPETDWHRDWKNLFPENYREVVFKDGDNFHRADIHTSKGVTIEFQNSPIPYDELNSRERFYEKLIWVVNGLKFKENFGLKCDIPNPESAVMKEFSVYGIGRFSERLMFKRDLINVYSISRHLMLSFDNEELYEVEKEYNEMRNTYWMFNWKYAHKVWLNSSALVFFDFGQEHLYWLKKRQQGDGVLHYVCKVSKSAFIKKYSS